jgi:hypothetical protein
MLGIRFLQIGDDIGATKALVKMQDNLVSIHAIKVRLNSVLAPNAHLLSPKGMVSSTVYNPLEYPIRVDVLKRILQDSINYAQSNRVPKSPLPHGLPLAARGQMPYY